ncbi:MAG TPA: M56 family metallopeptidase [Thermoanaerobaculia bacterium]|nr:M56 family metallopeptidase [Thermoanaerobaculia bacterium]
MNETMLSAIRFALDIALKATLLFSFTAAVIGLLRRSGAAARHLAGTAGLIAALALPLLTLALPRWEVRVLPDLFKSSRVTPVSSLAPDIERSDPASEARWETVGSAKETGSPVTPVNPPGRSVPWPLIAFAAWAAGSLLVGARLAYGVLRVHRIRLEAAPIRDSEWTEETRRLSRELELDRSVELLESARVPVAMTSGLLRPLLLLCRQARHWEVERRRVVLLHELAHVRRGDWLWLLLAEAAFAFYWWHPLAWALERQVRRDCERACDDLVLAAGTKPSVYAGHLLGIFRSLSAAAHPVAPAVASERTSHFEGRLRAILDPGQARRDLPRGRALVSATGLFAAAAVIAVVQPWTPVCAHAAIQSFSTDGEETLASPAATARATSPACKFKKAKPKPAGLAHPVSTSATSSVTIFATPSVTTSTTAFATTCASETTSATPSASEETVAPAEPLPESGRTVPAILKAIGAVKDAASGFVRASNQGHGKGARDGSDWYSRGMNFHRRERYDEAIEAFRKAIEAGYREDAASYNIACGYALKGDRDKAFEWLRRAEEAGFEVASYLGHDDDLDGLKSDPRWKALKASVEQHPSARQEREAAAAVKRYERIAAGPGSGEAYYDVGKELLDAGRFDLSARAFENAAHQGYRVGTSLYNEACALSRAGQTRAALDTLQKSLDAGFDQPDIFARDDDLDNVRDDPRFAAIQREAHDLALPGYNSWFLGSSRNRSKWREAARKFEEYTRAHPQKGRAWYNFGFASLAGDRPGAATEAFHKALELNYRKPTTMYNLACSYARLDQKDAAFDWLFKALDAGFDASGTLRGDEDLDNLRGDPRFRKALTIAKARDQAEDD